jgi:autotransporter-associated beta strand protein
LYPDFLRGEGTTNIGNEVNVFAGATVINSGSSQGDPATPAQT